MVALGISSRADRSQMRADGNTPSYTDFIHAVRQDLIEQDLIE
jgi:hypothetical protein